MCERIPQMCAMTPTITSMPIKTITGRVAETTTETMLSGTLTNQTWTDLVVVITLITLTSLMLHMVQCLVQGLAMRTFIMVTIKALNQRI